MMKVNLRQSKTTHEDVTLYVCVIDDGSIFIWRSDNDRPLDKFRKIWPNHDYLTIVQTMDTDGKEIEMLGYNVALSESQIDEQLNICKDEIKKAGAMHREKLRSDTFSVARTLQRAWHLIKGCFKRR